MNLSPNEIKSNFDKNGFIVIPNLYSQTEAAALKQEMQQFIEAVKQEGVAAGKNPEDVVRNGVCLGVAAHSNLYHQTVADDRLLDILELLIGPNIEFLSDKAVFKNAKASFSSPWHQDWPYWRGSHKISVWVALDDVSPENGCLKLLPGSHRMHAAHDGDASDGIGFDNRLKPGAVDEGQAVTAEMAAGGAAFFHDLTLHASHPNTAGKDRWIWIPTYRDTINDDPEYSWSIAARVVRGVK